MLLCSSTGQVPRREAVTTQIVVPGTDLPPSALYNTYMGEGGEDPILY